MNNTYVWAYVDGTIQANELVVFAVVFVGILGSVGGLYFKRRGRSTLELVNVKGPSSVSTPVLSSKLSGSSGASPAASAGSTASVELHPAVAALKAEMSERRVALGLMPGMMEQAQGAANAPGSQSSSSSVASLLPPDIRALAQAPKPPVPPTANAPPQSPPMLEAVQPVNPLPRLPMPTLSVARPSQEIMPMVRQSPPGVPVPRPVQPTVPAARPPAVIPQNVTTVITGIMPKKKDPNEPDDEKSSTK